MTRIGWDDQGPYYTAWDRIRDERRAEDYVCPNYREGTRRCNCKQCRKYRKDLADNLTPAGGR